LLQAAHRHRLAFAEDAGDLDAGDALQRFGDVGDAPPASFANVRTPRLA